VYIKNNLLLDYIYFKEISEAGWFFLDREKFSGEDIVHNLKSLKRDILKNLLTARNFGTMRYKETRIVEKRRSE